MTQVSPIGPPSSTASSRATEAHARSTVDERPERAPDRLELSEAARATPEIVIRHDLVAKIKAQIEAGTYDIASKLDLATIRVIDDLTS